MTETFCEMAAVPGRLAGPVRRLGFGRDFYPGLTAAGDRAFALDARPLAHEFDGQIAAFRSAHASLLGFLKNDAFACQRTGNACTHLYFDPLSAALLAFCATKCSAVKLRGDTVLSLCPAVEIAALCVDDRYRFQGVGQAILRRVLAEAEKIRAVAGVQYVTLFAVPDAVDFYLKCGFKKIGAAGKVLPAAAHSGCVPLYIPLPPAGDGAKPQDLQLALFA